MAVAGLVPYHAALPFGFDIGLAISIVGLVVLEHRHREVTRLENESELRQTQRRYQLALEGSADGIFEWDIQAAQVLASPRAHEILGLEYVPGWRAQSVIAALLGR
ncbi:MAG: hypothetical protein U5O39_11690 [Gammaproteobacteria bacterium]|nr:hypothetical protein [Gammaproteobacteria bacterium]